MPTPREQVSDDGFAQGVSKSCGFGAVESSGELTSLKEAETMLLEKEKRIDGMDPIQSVNEGRDIGALKMRNQEQLQHVRKEIARLSPAK